MNALPLEVPHVAAAALAVAAGAATGLARHPTRQRGWLWWVVALWGAALGALTAVLSTGPAARLLAEWLLMQAPVLSLVGLRRFHSRNALPGHALLDLALLALLALAACIVAIAAPLLLPPVATFGDAALLLYAAAVLFGAQPGREARLLRAQGGAWALLALALALPFAFGGLGADPWPLRLAAFALGGMFTAFVTLMMASDRTERRLRASHHRLRTLANLDALTQLPNRRHFAELASAALQADPPGSAVLLLFDIDHFKVINDTLGHAAGDRALALVSGSMLEQLREQDAAGRHGGDEFVLLLRHADTARALRVAHRIVLAVQLHATEHELPHLTLSFGLVQVKPLEALPDALVRADQALFEAKRQGRNCAVAAEGDSSHPVFSGSQQLGLSAA